jgi:hypothetical protein
LGFFALNKKAKIKNKVKFKKKKKKDKTKIKLIHQKQVNKNKTIKLYFDSGVSVAKDLVGTISNIKSKVVEIIVEHFKFELKS